MFTFKGLASIAMPGLFFCLLLSFSGCEGKGQKASVSPEAPIPGYKIGNLAPDFSLSTQTGETISLKDFRGQIVFLNFWATWCAPCREEMPAMEKLHQAMSKRNFVMLAISEDKEGWPVIAPFVKELNLSFLIVHDTDQKVAQAYHSIRYPETFIIDERGVIIDKRLGAAPWGNQKFLDYFIQKTKEKK